MRYVAPLVVLCLWMAGAARAQTTVAPGSYTGSFEVPQGVVRANPRPRTASVTLHIVAVEQANVTGSWEYSSGPCKGTYPFRGLVMERFVGLEFADGGPGRCPPSARIRVEVKGDGFVWRHRTYGDVDLRR